MIRRSLLSMAMLCLGSLSFERASAAQDGTAPGAPRPAPVMVVTVSVDWEGQSLLPQNLGAMGALRADFPDVPLTHFLNAAYFTKEDAEGDLEMQIREVLRDRDELGLHLHCWRSLVTAAGVEFRDRPTYWGRPSRPRGGGDYGHEVELDAYGKDEVRKIVRTSLDTLEHEGFELSHSFRCPAWRATPKIWEAIRAEGLLLDSSATDPHWHAEELAGLPLLDGLHDLWGEFDQHRQPFPVKTESGTLLELPDTGALADYVTGEEMIGHLEAVHARALAEGAPRFAHIGFHQETAQQFLPRVRECLERWTKAPDVVFVTLEEAARRFRELHPEPNGASDPDRSADR